jgi:hypothetical protein
MSDIIENVIEKLRDDESYYGEYGRQYMSNSDIKVLLDNPSKFGVPTPDNPAFAKGRLFHQLILEPEKAAKAESVNTVSRNSKVYKEACAERGVEFMLLTKEMEEIHGWAQKMLGNYDFFEAIRDDANVYEEPIVGTIMGRKFKGKADIICPDRVIDLKTTSNIDDFKWSARKYGYDSQCYIYETLFGVPLVFFVIDKKTGRMGMYEPSEDFITRGREKVERALEVYDKFFGPDATDTIETFYITQTL